MWGESRDASLATLYKLPHDDHLHLPPQPTAAKGGAAPGAEQTTPSEKEMQEEQAYENEIFPSPEPKPHIGDQGDDDDQQKWTTATTTKRRRPKPTEHLPSDHDVRPGHSDLALDPTIPSDVPQLDAEQDEPASSNQVSSSTPSSAKATSSYFSSMTSLMKDSTWIYIAAPLAALFGASLLGFFWWRRRRATGNGRGRYGFEPVAGGEDEGVPMTEPRTATSSTTGARTTRDLYDAFGVGSDDEDSDDDHQQQYKSHTSFRDVEAASPATRSAEELFNRDSDGR